MKPPTPLQYFKRLIKPATVRIYHATFGMIVFVLAMTTVALATYRDVQLDLTSDIEVFHIMFERCHTKIERNLSNSL